ncbi:hypothetical protein COOONC_24907 [Cooperia oncophora]
MTDIDYIEFGLCDHNVCRRCYDTAESADHEGIHGCCNADCLELAKKETTRKRKVVKRAEKRRARRLPQRSMKAMIYILSEVYPDSFRMQYDDSELQKFVDGLNIHRNARSADSSTTE